MDIGAIPPEPAATIQEDPTGQLPDENFRSPALVEQWAQRGRVCVIHTTAFGLFLMALRVDKVALQEIDVTPLGWLQVLSSEALLLLLLEALWLLTVRVAPKRTRTWVLVYALFHAPIYLLMVSSHRFYRETGIIPQWDILSYAAHEFSALRTLLATGLDAQFAVMVVAAVASLLCIPITATFTRNQNWGANILLPALMTLVGASLVVVPKADNVQLVTLGGNWLTDLLPDQAAQEYLNRAVTVHPVYSTPVLEPALAGEAANMRPNFLFVLLESTRTDLFSAYSGKPSLTPFLDGLAARSVIVDNAYTTTSHTSKALVGILCGMNPVPVMQMVETRPGGLPLQCLPKLLHDAGYISGFFQAAGDFESRDGLIANMGFDHAFIPGPVEGSGFEQVGYLGWDERVMIRPAVEWMARATRPFFATVLTVSTHHPYDSPGSGPSPSWSVAQQHYEHAASYVDGQLRLLFDRLEHAGILENTIVFLLGDHGEAFNERSGFRQHDRVPYEDVTHVPLFIYAPKYFAPRHITGLRQHTDLIPTVLERAHLTWKGQLPGSSLFTSPGHDFIMTSCWYANSCLSLRKGDLSFVFHFGHIPLEVFDLSTDPQQRHDIASEVPAGDQDAAIDGMLNEVASIHTYYSSLFSSNAPR